MPFAPSQVRRYRTLRGLSQTQLGKLLGVNNRTVSTWETGAARPSFDRLEALADVLEVRLTDLLESETTNGHR